MFRLCVIGFAFALACASAAGCSDHKGPSTTPTSTTASVRADDGTVAATIGASVSFDALVRPDALGPHGDLAGAFKVGSKIVVWLRLADEPAAVETSAQFGYAEVRSVDGDGARFTVTGRVPSTVWRREQRMTPLTAVPTAPGVYEVSLQGFFAQRLTVRAGELRPTSTTTTPAPAPANSKLLGAADLAGIAFGLDEQTAFAQLTQRFGKPAFDEQHNSTCGATRLVGWGSLMVAFRDPAAVETSGARIAGTGASGSGAGLAPSRRVFTDYVYSAAHAGTAEGPTDLRTASGVGPGSSLAELQARDPGVVFVTDQVGYSATTWYSAPGSRLAGRLSDDVSASDVTVVEIASIAAGDGATYPGC